MILKYNALSSEDLSWSTDTNITNGVYYEFARVVMRVPRVFALADYYARAENSTDAWEPANLAEVAKAWIAKGGNVNERTCNGFKLADLLVLAAAPKTTDLIREAGAILNYRTPFVLKDGFLAYYNRDHSYGAQFSVNFQPHGSYFYGNEHPSFSTTYVNKCVTDAEVENIGMTYVEFLVYTLVGGQRGTKTLLGMLKSVVGEIDLPKDIVHAVLYHDNFPRKGLDVLDVLLAAGADINARNASGQTLIERVFNAGAGKDLLQELRSRGAQL